MGQRLSAVNDPGGGRSAEFRQLADDGESGIDDTAKRMQMLRAMVAVKPSLTPGQRLGRRVGIAVFGLIVSTVTAVWTIQILHAVFAPPVLAVAQECRSGTRDLLTAVRRASLAAAAESGDERAALGRFRAALEPEWSTRASLDSICRADRQAKAALAEIDALRYAEEHAVRYEAVGLAPQRRRVQALYQFESDGPKRPAPP